MLVTAPLMTFSASSSSRYEEADPAASETITTPSGELAAEARVVTVRWDTVLRKPSPFTEAERARLEVPAAGSAGAAGQTGP